MKRRIKNILSFFIYYSGISWLYSLITKKRLRVINYHIISNIQSKTLDSLQVELNNFLKQINFLKKKIQYYFT